MYRVAKLSGKWYAMQFDDLVAETDNILAFLEEGTAVILVSEIQQIQDIVEEEICIVEEEKE